MQNTEVVALGFRYPTPVAAAELSRLIEADASNDVKRHMRQFVNEVGELSLGEWEELHTDTLDLDPKFVPYVGHVAWGENYRRGAFMADLVAAMAAADVDLMGELPDHIEPILRYLAADDEPLADLVEVLPRVISEMNSVLKTAAPDNPYCHLLAATLACAGNRPVTIGGRR
ncbi:MAG: nitrate reductase [Actinobacteria bacterium]|nr:nitrate reductase [Actinomycetota bacterium]